MSDLADQIELAEARRTIEDAERYLRWLNREGEYAPENRPARKLRWYEFLPGPIPMLRYMPLPPPFPVSPEQVRRAEQIIARPEK